MNAATHITPTLGATVMGKKILIIGPEWDQIDWVKYNKQNPEECATMRKYVRDNKGKMEDSDDIDWPKFYEQNPVVASIFRKRFEDE